VRCRLRTIQILRRAATTADSRMRTNSGGARPRFKSATSGKAGGMKERMAQSHTALRAINRLRWKCQRGSHSECHLSPHPGPLPRGEGEFSAGLQQNPTRFLLDELPEQPRLPPLFPLPVGKGQGEGKRRGHPDYWTVPGTVKLGESSGGVRGFPK